MMFLGHAEAALAADSEGDALVVAGAHGTGSPKAVGTRHARPARAPGAGRAAAGPQVPEFEVLLPAPLQPDAAMRPR